MTATVILRLANFWKTSNSSRVYLELHGPGVTQDRIDVTDLMGKRVTYTVPADAAHSYRIVVDNGPNLPPMRFEPTQVFQASVPQAKLPITQYVRDAICATVV